MIESQPYAPSLIVGSPRIMMLPRRLAEKFADIHPIKFVDLSRSKVLKQWSSTDYSIRLSDLPFR